MACLCRDCLIRGGISGQRKEPDYVTARDSFIGSETKVLVIELFIAHADTQQTLN